VCFSRLRSIKCAFCIHDRDSINVKLVHVLCDELEDRQGRRASKT
jgi:hypothetical protein